MFLRYGVAVLTTAVATLVRGLLHPMLGPRVPFITFFISVMLAGWYGGMGPALLTMGLGALAAAYFFIPPDDSLAVSGLENQLALAIYCLVGILTACLSDLMRAAQRKAEVNARESLERQHALEREIEERHRLEGERRREGDARARLAAIVESSSDAIIGKTLDGEIVSWNAAAERLYGYTSDEVVGRPISLLAPPERVDEAAQILERIRLGERVAEQETVRVRKDGTRLDVSVTVSPVRDESGHVIGAATIARDITRRKRAHEAQRFLAEASRVLASSLDFEKTIASVAQLAVPHIADWCTVDVVEADGSLRNLVVAHTDPARVAWAHELQRRYPADPDATGGVPQVVRTGQSELHPHITEAMLEEVAKNDEELRILREVGFVSVMIVPLTGRERTLGAISLISSELGRHYDADDLALAENLAGRAAMAMENARLYGEVQEAGRQKDAFLAMLGHELRSPLTAIGNTLHLVRRRASGDPDLHALGDRVERQVRRMGRLIDDLQDVSRIREGKVSLRCERLDLGPLVRETSEDQRSAFEGAGLQLRVDLPEEPVTVLGDPTRLAQILVNLLNNASKFTDPGGEVSVRLKRNGNWGTISVRDSGIGIEPQMLPRIFESFVQEERSLGRTRGGLGLGLALVRGLVELHGGEVHVSSPGRGCGSEFAVCLPLAPPHEKG